MPGTGSPQFQAHQDPTFNPDPARVTMIEFVTTMIAQLDRRVEAGQHEVHDLMKQRFVDADLRYEQRFQAQEQALAAAFAAQKEAVLIAQHAAEKAVAKAEAATEKRFDAVNEFRGQLSDQAATFMPRMEAEQRIAALSEKLDILRTAATLDSGRSTGLNAGWGYLLGAAGLASAVIGIIVGTR
jgi:Fe2+ transport system protein B